MRRGNGSSARLTPSASGGVTVRFATNRPKSSCATSGVTLSCSTKTCGETALEVRAVYQPMKYM
jgi:hypothetical protein